MSELITLALTSLPVLAFVALVVETIRVARNGMTYPTFEPTYRAYSA